MGKYVTQTYLADLQGVAVEAFTFGGRLMGLPAFAESVALIYNKKYVKEPPRTWEEFLALAQKLTTGATFGFLYNIGDPYFNFGFFKAFGAENVFAKDAKGNLDPTKLLIGGEVGRRPSSSSRTSASSTTWSPRGWTTGWRTGPSRMGPWP